MRNKVIMRAKALLVAGSLILAMAMTCVGCTVIPQPMDGEYASDITVTVAGGKVTGTKNGDETVAIYKGIPYAAAPIGDLRWKAPQPHPGWDGEFDCSLWGANALQGEASVFSYWTEEFVQDTEPSKYRGGVVYSEDCLTLNVWSSYAATYGKPVLVYIHGGGYNSGGASCEVYDGEAMAKRNVVFVSIQYRVGALGYLATQALIDEDENGSAGNYGLLDQIAALRWVRENIRTFGGDPNNVTVMGQSAGAGSVNALIASPLAKGLFTNAVSLSCYPSIGGGWDTAEDRCKKIALSYNGKPLAQMTCAELREIPAEFLAGKTLPDIEPCIDGYALTDTYVNALRGGKANPVNLLSGNVEKDDEIMSFYKTNDITSTDSMLALQNALSKIRDDNGEYDTYVYMFSRNVPKATSVATDTTGARHSYELAYFLGNFSTASGRQWTEADHALGQAMTTYLASFCKTGKPSGDDLPDWKQNNGDYNYMSFDEFAQSKTMSESKTQTIIARYGLNY